MYTVQVTDDVTNIASHHQSEPYVIVVGTFQCPQQAFIAMDKKILTEIDVNDTPLYLIAVFYVFNICYPHGCSNFYSFLEVALLGLKEPSITVPPSVTNMLARLAAL